nr:hypothetical protein [Lachnospiraceae bacterium]
MRRTLNKWFGADIPLELAYFNISVAFICMLCFILVFSGMYIGAGKLFYYIIIVGLCFIAFLSAYTMQTEKYDLSLLGLNALLEFLILPGIYVSDGRFLSFALVYYFFPLLTTVFMRNKRFRVTAYILFALSFI